MAPKAAGLSPKSNITPAGNTHPNSVYPFDIFKQFLEIHKIIGRHKETMVNFDPQSLCQYSSPS
jgi:hypothetical protein